MSELQYGPALMGLLLLTSTPVFARSGSIKRAIEGWRGETRYGASDSKSTLASSPESSLIVSSNCMAGFQNPEEAG